MTRPRGIRCPRCDVRPVVEDTRTPAPGVRTRYLSCPTPGCKWRGVSVERVVRTLPPKTARPRPNAFRTGGTGSNP
jgi:hypothetical protein